MFEQLQSLNELKGCISVQQFLKNIQTHLNRTNITIDTVNNTINNKRNGESIVFVKDIVLYKFKDHTFKINSNEKTVEINYPENITYSNKIDLNVGDIFLKINKIKEYISLYDSLKKFRNNKYDFSSNLQEWKNFYLSIKHLSIVSYGIPNVIDNIDLLIYLNKKDEFYFINEVINNYKIINTSANIFSIECKLSNGFNIHQSSRPNKSIDEYIYKFSFSYSQNETDRPKVFNVVDEHLSLSVNNNKLKELKEVMLNVNNETNKINACFKLLISINKYLMFADKREKFSLEELELLLLTTDNKSFDELASLLKMNQNKPSQKKLI